MPQSIPVLRPNGSVLIFGGCYSNLEATQALLREAARLEIPPNRMVCNGDVVAYAADAAATVRLVRSSVPHVVMGNCEDSLAAGADDCGCGFPEGSAFEALSGAWFAHAGRQLKAPDRAWMRNLPRRIDLEIGRVRLAIVHGGVRKLNRFVFASTAAAIKRDEILRAGVQGIIGGHCGLPFTQDIDRLLWHNSGAIGMPANDGTPRAWFSIVSDTGDGLAIEHRAFDYDHTRAAAKMRAAALPEGYSAALESGLWPSCDVLPADEIKARGAPLQAGTVVWRAPQGEKGRTRGRAANCEALWPAPPARATPRLNPLKFVDPEMTLQGEPRARVALERLNTLWFNTGTLCNITCRNCYIESSPRNDALAYLTRADVACYLDEIAREGMGTQEIGFTGGEPFMNPDFLDILGTTLARGFAVLVLTNAMRPMQRGKARLIEIGQAFGQRLTLRVSLDHFTPERHEEERGPGTFRPTLDGLVWLARGGFNVTVAGRTMWGEAPERQREGYARLFAEHAIPVDASDPAQLVLFPEMDAHVDVPEITTACWRILGKSPADVMCSHSRMIVRRRGADRPAVVACTLLPYDRQFELGDTLAGAARRVALNHPHCARFCVLGGASCQPAPRGGQESRRHACGGAVPRGGESDQASANVLHV